MQSVAEPSVVDAAVFDFCKPRISCRGRVSDLSVYVHAKMYYVCHLRSLTA